LIHVFGFAFRIEMEYQIEGCGSRSMRRFNWTIASGFSYTDATFDQLPGNGLDRRSPTGLRMRISLTLPIRFKDSDGRNRLHPIAGDNIRISLLANRNDASEDVFAVSDIGSLEGPLRRKGLPRPRPCMEALSGSLG